MTSDFPFNIERELQFSFRDADHISGVYVIYNVVSKLKYVGRARGIGQRLRNDHYKDLTRSTRPDDKPRRMIRDRDRLGLGVAPYRFAILEICKGWDGPVEAEARWIQKLKPEYNEAAGFSMPIF